MRDILLTLIVAGLLPVAFRRPWVGALMFAWMSIMNPHKLTWGFANGIPWAQIIAFVTITGFIFAAKDQRKPVPWSMLLAVYLALIVWMSVTSLFALGDPTWVLGRWIFVMKIHVMVLMTLVLIRDRQHINLMVWVVVGSVAFYGVKGGVATIITGGSIRVWGAPGGMIEDNNALAVALVVMTPLMFYLYSQSQRRLIKWGLGVGALMMAFAILGTQSRGALLAFITMTFFLGIKSAHPVRNSLMLGILALIAIAFMPESWTDRMETIKSYQEDTSAMSRIYTWITLWNLSMDRPFLGGGFGTDTLNVFRRYAPVEPPYDAFTGTVWVAHSIYFQALGEHGFPGLALYLLFGGLFWRMATRASKLAKDDPEFKDWVPLLMRMCQVSLMGFAAGAAFLSLMHLDVPYYIVAVVMVTHATVVERQKSRSARSPVQQASAVPESIPQSSAVPGSAWSGQRT